MTTRAQCLAAFVIVYISVSAVMAAIGFAFTASHFEKNPKVTKGLQAS
jgi:hypothetical protein